MGHIGSSLSFELFHRGSKLHLFIRSQIIKKIRPLDCVISTNNFQQMLQRIFKIWEQTAIFAEIISTIQIIFSRKFATIRDSHRFDLSERCILL